MTGDDYEAAKPVPTRSGVTGDPWAVGPPKSDRYMRRTSDGERVCRTCGSLVSNHLAHDLFHNRFNLMGAARTCAMCGHQAVVLGGSVTEPDGTHYDLCHGCEGRGVDEGHDCYHRWTVYGDRPKHDDPCDCDDCRPQPTLGPKTDTPTEPIVMHNYEPPVGSVARCFGCGNVYVHRADGWLATDGPFLESWGNLARSFCGPVKVIYNPEEDK